MIWRGRIAFSLAVTAVALVAALIPLALLLPVYSSGQSLVEVNGTGVLAPVAVPAFVAALAAVALHVRCATGSDRAQTLALMLIVVLGFYSVFFVTFGGLFALPSVALLFLAAALTPGPHG